MIEFRYVPNNPKHTADALTLTFPEADDGHISKIHRLCKAFVLALGYEPENVEDYFGESDYTYD